MAASIATREPEYSDDDVEQLLEWQRREHDIGSHGQRLSRSTSSEANPANRKGAYKYVAGDPVTDWAERARRDKEDAYRKGRKNVPNGLIFPVWEVPR